MERVFFDPFQQVANPVSDSSLGYLAKFWTTTAHSPPLKGTIGKAEQFGCFKFSDQSVAVYFVELIVLHLFSSSMR